MKTLWMATGVILSLGLWASGPASAQGPFTPGAAPLSPPPYSPYLNLLRRGNPTYINYYGLVRPEFNFRNQINGLQQGVAANAAAITTNADALNGLPLTGHPTQFLNTSHYFLNRGGQGSSGAGQAGLAPRTAMQPSGGSAAQPSIRR